MNQEPLTGKQKRMMEAARLRYMEDLTGKEIAGRLGLSHSTVRKYFSSSEMQQFKRFYSDREKFRLEQAIEQDLSDAESIAREALGEAKRRAEDSSDYRQVAEAALRIRQRKIDLLQELGVLEKPKERKEVEQTVQSGDDESEFLGRVQDAYREKMQDEEESEEGKDKVEAKN